MLKTLIQGMPPITAVIGKIRGSIGAFTITSNFIINISSVDRADKFDLMAFNLKEGNTFKLARMLYSKKDIEGLTRHLDKLLETRIQQIKSSDFVLPQTSADVIMENAQTQNINGYSVKVAKASDIDNFYAFIHTPEAAFAFPCSFCTISVIF